MFRETAQLLTGRKERPIAVDKIWCKDECLVLLHYDHFCDLMMKTTDSKKADQVFQIYSRYFKGQPIAPNSPIDHQTTANWRQWCMEHGIYTQ